VIARPVTQSGQRPVPGPVAAGSGEDPDLTLQSQRQRKVQLAHEASLLNKAGRTEELQRCLEAMLVLDPDDPQALYNLAVLIYRQGEKTRPERLLRRVIVRDPDYVDAYQALGDMHYESRHLLSAIEIYERGLRQIPTRLQLLSSLLRACSTMRSPQRVEAVARRILDIDEDDSHALNFLGWAIILRGGDLDDADRRLRRALERRPHAPTTLAIAECLAEIRGEPEAAAEHREHIDELAKQNWQIAHLAAETFMSLKRMERAAGVVREYLAEHPDDPSAHRYLAVALMQDGDFAGGHQILAQILDMAQDRPTLQMVYCLNAFRLGDLESFFKYHRTRWAREGAEELWKLPAPEWDGQAIKSGKLVVQCEQGVGDYVMYAVCFPGLAPRARDVIVKAMPRMLTLFRRSFPEFQVIPHNELPPGVSMESVAAWAAAGDLPELLGGDIERLPGKSGVLVADPALKLKLRKRYEDLFPGKRLIGISWRSGNRDSAATRSLELPYWKPLFDLEDCAFISLQYGDITRDLEELKEQLGDKVYWDKEIVPTGDLDPFTAQISALDMVVSVDNSTVHFAGGLGKPCWAMLPLNSDWRWQIDRSDTVWYDSVELIRPDKERGWDGAIEGVAQRMAVLDDAPLKQAEIAYLKRALAVMMRGDRVAEAEQYARMLLAAGADKAQAMRAIARSAGAAGKTEDAVAILHRAGELDPEDPGIQADMAQALSKAGNSEQGLAVARELRRRFPDNDEVSTACGRILSDLGRYDEATDFFARVLRRDADNAASRLSLAGLQAAQGDFELARRNYDRILQIDPSNASAHTALAEILLRTEQWAEGWPEFRWRFGARPGVLPPHLAAIEVDKQPKVWTEGSLRKQRVFLGAERNLTEQLLLASLLGEAARESRTVTLECDTRLSPIMIASFPAIEVMARGTLDEAGIRDRGIQMVATLGNLAQRLRATGADFPARPKPWLTADPTRVAELRQEYRASAEGRRLVGLSWRHGRDVPGWPTPAEVWLPLFDRPDVKVVGLHPGPRESGLVDFVAQTGRDLIFDRRIDFSRDLGDYAAQVQACDCVIAVEDLTAVMAAACGKPTVKLKKPVDHWWWGADEAQNRWFPALRTVSAPNGIRAFEVAVAIGMLDTMPGAK
jgi:tetratricopeptide (TPR) repeat protein